MDRLASLTSQLDSTPRGRRGQGEIRRAIIVEGRRTPFTRAFGKMRDLDTVDLGAAAVGGLLEATVSPF